MAEQRRRGSDGARDYKENMARQSNTPRSAERAPPAAHAPAPAGATTLRTFFDAFTIGRSRRCDLVIPTSEDTRTISKTHARIFHMRDAEHGDGASGRSNARKKWILQDLNTLNGTAINGMDLMPGGSMELHDGDELMLSSNMRTGMRLHIQIPDADQSRLIARLYGPYGANWQQHAPSGHGNTPTWHGWSSRASTPQPDTHMTPHGSDSASSLTKRQRSTDDRSSRHSSNGQDASSEAHGGKRSRRDDGDDKERLMLCPVCLDYFYNSATLACSHTFCGHCIGHWFRTSGTLSCPECRASVKHMPVRNRALDDLVAHLAGDTDAYRVAVRKRTTEERVGASFAPGNFDLRTHPFVFTPWSTEAVLAFSTFIRKQFGEQRIAACRQVGLTEAAIDAAAGVVLGVAAENLLMDVVTLHTSHEARDRLKIYLHYG